MMFIAIKQQLKKAQGNEEIILEQKKKKKKKITRILVSNLSGPPYISKQKV